MAPDLNSVPNSPHPRHQQSPSIRTPSQAMAPPPIPPASPGARIPSASTREPATASTSSTEVGPGPLRHPRPLTAADLHMQLEKEQEAVVNKLTRELSLLRQQTASVASTTSSTSTGLPDSTDHNANHLLSGPSHPTPSRRHRSSSSVSTRSTNTPGTTVSGFTGISGNTVGTTGGVAGSTISGIAPARDTPRHVNPRESLSRNGSIASRRSEASSPSLASSLQQGDHFPNLYSNRHSIPSQPHQAAANPGSNRSSYAPTARYEEAAHHRSELEMVKKENESLRRRIRELERSLSSRRQSDATRRRSDSMSTGVSVRSATMGGTQERANTGNDDDDVVNVGESAGSVGLGGGQ